MNQPPLNPDALDETALANLIAWKSLPFGATQFVKLDANAAHKVIELLRPHLAAALPEVTSVDYLATAEGHYDAWMDSGDGYTQRKGWTLTCIWCRAEFTGATKREALQGYRGHEESILQKLREADAAERAKNRPEVKP